MSKQQNKKKVCFYFINSGARVPHHLSREKISLEFKVYDTNEFNAPTTNTKSIQRADPENTSPLLWAHPSGEARSTGTPITRANESPMKARSVSWKIKSIGLNSLKIDFQPKVQIVKKLDFLSKSPRAIIMISC